MRLWGGGGQGGGGFVILVSDRGKRDRVHNSGVAGGGEGAAFIILVLLRGKQREQGLYFWCCRGGGREDLQ